MLPLQLPHMVFIFRSDVLPAWDVHDEVRRLASERASTNLIQQAAIRAGMRPLREDGWRKACRGVTTVEEVLRVTKSD